MTTKFAKPKARFDRSQARDGVWFLVEDENGYEYGSFKCGLFDANIPRIRIIMDRINRASAAKAKNRKEKGDDVRANVETFVEAVLFDWNLKDEDGKAIKFTPENAVEYFTAYEIDEDTGEKSYIYDYVFSSLLTYVRDVTNFQSDDQVEAGDATGN